VNGWGGSKRKGTKDGFNGKCQRVARQDAGGSKRSGFLEGGMGGNKEKKLGGFSVKEGKRRENQLMGGHYFRRREKKKGTFQKGE